MTPVIQNENEIEIAQSVFSDLRKTAPVTRDNLRNYVKVFLGID